MSDAFEIRLTDAARELLDQGIGPRVIPALLAAMDAQNELTAGAAVERRMSLPRTDPPTLEGTRVQTGRLRQSIRTSQARFAGDTLVSSIGSNVRYFGVHEFGFDGAVEIPAHTCRKPLRFLVAGNQKTISVKSARRLGLFTKAGKPRAGHSLSRGQGAYQVRAHTAQMHFPARRMVSTTIAERANDYATAIETALRNALNEGQP